MNQFKNGTLLVAIATVVIAVIMLMTGRDSNTESAKTDEVAAVESETSVADPAKTEVEKEASVSEPEVAVIEKEEKISAVAEVTSDSEKVTEENVVEKAVESTVQSTLQKNEQSSLESVEKSLAIKAPEGPFNKKMDESKVAENTVAEKIEEVTSKVTEPETSVESDQAEAVKAESIKAVATSAENDSANEATAPIWMDQKLGEFKSVAEDEVVFKLLPTESESEASRQDVIGNNGEISSSSISADYYYQQTPMYNGGYYIAPMPQYLMESTLPLSGKYSK